MSCYISSNNNRFYVALESSYGVVPEFSSGQRIPAVKLAARQIPEQTQRRDKTGSRTFAGLPNAIRKRTSYQLSTFMTEWANREADPTHGPLFQAAMGGTPRVFGGGVVASTNGATQVTFTTPHGLQVGQGVTAGGEIRFVTNLQDATTVFLNAALSTPLVAGEVLGSTVTYRLATEVGSVSLLDAWDPNTTVQRILSGAAVDSMRIKVNGDFHEFVFGGPAKDVLDSASFTAGVGGLSEFPAEPVGSGFDYTIVPGHLGQVWMGAPAAPVMTLTAAELLLSNNIQLRNREFGSDAARCIAAGQRSIGLNFSIFADDAADTKGLYQAARQRSPIAVMLQLGQQAGQLFGAYLPAMVLEIPEFDDQETRLQWRFHNSRAQGTVDDELYIAFG